MKILSIFDAAFLINLERRGDRMAESAAELQHWGIDGVQRFEAYDHPTSGHIGCSRSHRELIREIADGPWEKVLVMEDDVAAITKSRLLLAGFKPEQEVWKTHCSILNGDGNVSERFAAMVPFLPDKWDVLYLGGGYGEPPISRFNKHVVRCAGMMTTSSYGITREFAKKWTAAADSHGDLDHHIGPIDLFFSSLARENLFYVLQPRLIFQRQSQSDLDGGNHSRLFDMSDAVHEQMV